MKPHLFQFFTIFLVILCLLPLYSNAAQSPPYPATGNLPTFQGSDGELEDMEFRVTVSAGKSECFYQEAKKNHQLEVSFQVIEMAASPFHWLAPGGKGDMLIDFEFLDPKGTPIKREIQQREGSVVHSVLDDGTFTICFDNTGTYSTKLVNVEVYLYSTEDEDRWGGRIEHENSYTYPPEVQSAESIANIQASINKVRDDMINIRHFQDERQAIERRDRNIAENNFTYVNRFSMCSIIVMIAAGAMQVVVIRSLFEEKSVFKKVLKGFKD